MFAKFTHIRLAFCYKSAASLYLAVILLSFTSLTVVQRDPDYRILNEIFDLNSKAEMLVGMSIMISVVIARIAV